MQTSLKRCGLKFSLRWDMSAKFPRGEAGPFLARSLFVVVAAAAAAAAAAAVRHDHFK